MISRLLLVALICAVCAPLSFAQPAGGGNQNGGGAFVPAPGMAGGVAVQGGGGGMRMMAGVGAGQHKPQTLEAIKQQLGCTDEEWEKLSPKVEKVLDAKRNMVTGAGMSWSSMNGGAPVFKVSDGKIDTPCGKAMQEVRTVLEDKDAPPDEINKKLAALKEARDKAKAEVDAAQKELMDALTPRQQAILATLGTLE